MFHCLPDSAWADGNLAEAAGQLGKLVEHRNQSQPNPGLRSLGTPCIPCCFCCTVNQRYFEGSVDERGGIDFIHVPGTEGFYGSNPGTNCILMSVELGYSFGNLVRAVLLYMSVPLPCPVFSSFTVVPQYLNVSATLQLSVPPLKLPPSTLGGSSEFNHRHIHLQSPPGELG